MADPRPPAGTPARAALRRDARRGFGIGAVLAAAVFVRFALLPGTALPLGLYVGLAIVLGVAVGLLATVVLVGWRGRRWADEG